MMKKIVKFAFNVSLLVALLVGAEYLMPTKQQIIYKTKVKKVYKKVPIHTKKIYVINKHTLVTKTCNNGKCNKRVRIKRVTKTN